MGFVATVSVAAHRHVRCRAGLSVGRVADTSRLAARPEALPLAANPRVEVEQNRKNRHPGSQTSSRAGLYRISHR
jgi:hypothetical protein